jgi:hypothetical protein
MCRTLMQMASLGPRVISYTYNYIFLMCIDLELSLIFAAQICGFYLQIAWTIHQL